MQLQAEKFVSLMVDFPMIEKTAWQLAGATLASFHRPNLLQEFSVDMIRDYFLKSEVSHVLLCLSEFWSFGNGRTEC